MSQFYKNLRLKLSATNYLLCILVGLAGVHPLLVTAETIEGSRTQDQAPGQPVQSGDSGNEETTQNSREQAGPGKRPAVLLRVSLPVTVSSAVAIKSALQKIAESAPMVVRPADRLAVVLEFDTDAGKTGRGSELEACQLLARYLVSAELNRIETIAYIPGRSSDRESRLSGHAVLIALAANQIAMDVNASMGDAGIDETAIDNLLREVYRGIASQRLTLPVPMALAMLDKERQLFRVQTDRGALFVDGEELADLEAQGKAIETSTLVERGNLGSFTSRQLEDFRFIRHRVRSRGELAAVLNLIPNALEQSPAFEGQWRAVEVNLGSYIDDRAVQWVMRSLGSQLARSNPPNLAIINFDDNNGNLDACLKLARFLVDLEPGRVQTVAHVTGNVRGPAAMLALCCDQLIMSKEARLGGTLDEIDQEMMAGESMEDLLPIVRGLARDQQKDWSLMMGMLNPELTVNRSRHNVTGQVRLLSAEELRSLDDRESWVTLGPIDLGRGITGKVAEELLVARTIANDRAELHAFYQLEQAPLALQMTAADRYVERFANFLTRPEVSMLLLFMAVFLLSGEMSSPGLGIAGFFSALFFMLFFWSHYLEGNAGWFEILLFLFGVAFILIEIFAVPGLGIFGIGGSLMIIVSLILASQNFAAFRSIEDLNKLPSALMPVVGGMAGFITALFVLRKVIPNSPFLKRLILDPGQDRQDLDWEHNRDREAIVDWSYLQGLSGEAMTRLAPAGKARIDGKVYDVITDGRMIDKGQPIEVIEAIGNRVVVRSKED